MNQSPVVPGTRVHSFTDDALGSHDAVGLLEEIEAGRVSRAELAEASIERIQKVDGDLAAIAAERFDQARREAQESCEGPFRGIPSLIKDNCAYAGLPTQMGSAAYTAEPEKSHGPVAELLEGLGLTVVGKTQMPEFGFTGGSEFRDRDPVRNAWDLGRIAAGSSSGSATLVAAGAVPMAHGNDGGGSIRMPAACNGLVGLKPSRGRTPSDKSVDKQPVRIVADGVLTRSVRDTAAFMRETEKLHRALRFPPIGDVTGPGRKRLRIALSTKSIDRPTAARTDSEVRRIAALLEDLGHHVEEISVPVPGFIADDFVAYWAALALYMEINGKRLYGPTFDKSKLETVTSGLSGYARRHLARVPLAIVRLQASQYVSRRFFKKFDLALTPTLAHETPEVGWMASDLPHEVIFERMMDWATFSPLANMTGDPAITLPLGTEASGMPLGVMFMASQGNERTLLELAFELEEAHPFARIQD